MGGKLNIGIDLVEVSKVRKIFEKSKTLQEEIFTQAEIRSSMCRRLPFVHLATRFVIKEALFKALKTGLSAGMDWRDVEVRREKSGGLRLHLRGRTAELANDRGVIAHHLAWSYTHDYAVGLVLLVRDSSSEKP